MCARKRDEGYNDWLKQTDAKDTKETRKWYETPDEKRGDFIKKNIDWWDKF